MWRALGVVGVVLLCALSFVVGSSGGTLRSEGAAEPDWRAAARHGAASADARSARRVALELLATTTTEPARVQAIALLAAVALPEDERLLESIARSGQPSLAGPAMNALALVHTNESMAALVELSRSRNTGGPALEALGRSGDIAALPLLTEALDDPWVEYQAAAGLVALANDQGTQLLIDRYEQSQPWDAQRWAEHLAALPEDQQPARQALIEATRSLDESRRESAMVVLARHRAPGIHTLLESSAGFGDHAAVRSLALLDDARSVQILKELVDRGGPLGEIALGSLGEMAHPDAVAALLGWIEAVPESRALQSLSVLVDLREPDVLSTLLRAVSDGSPAVSRRAGTRLLRYPWGARVPAGVLELARARLDRSEPEIQDAIGVLVRHGSAADQTRLQEKLVDGPREVRQSAVWTLREIPGAAADALLLQLVEDPSGAVNSSAISAAIIRGGLDEEVQRVLLRQLDADPQATRVVAAPLVRMRSAEGIRRLEELAQKGTPGVRSMAIEALIASSDRKLIWRLVVDADRFEPADQRRIYSAALHHPAVDPMALADQILQSGSDNTHILAAQALARSGTEEANRRLLALSNEQALLPGVLDVLAGVGGPEVEARLISALEDPSTARSAIRGLSRIGSVSAREAVAHQARTASDSQTRLAAVGAFMGVSAPQSVAVFTEALDDADPAVRRMAIDGLIFDGSKSAMTTLVDALDSSNARAVAEALKRIGGRYYRENRDRIDGL